MSATVAAIPPALQRLQDALHAAHGVPRFLVPTMQGERSDVLLCFAVALALLALRVALERRLLPALRALLARVEGTPDNAAIVFDDLFVALSAGALVVGGWVVMVRANGGCLPWAPSACLQGWPDHPVSPDFRLIWIASAGFYLYEIAGTLMGVPLLSVEMMVHHVVTLSLMAASYWYGLNRYGTMGVFWLDTSNPLLHAAKACNHSGAPSLFAAKERLFHAFALCFFVVRVVTPPFNLLWPGWRDSRHMPTHAYFLLNGLMLAVYLMQLMWFRKIVQLATKGIRNYKDDEHGTSGGSRRIGSKAASQASSASPSQSASPTKKAAGGDANGVARQADATARLSQSREASPSRTLTAAAKKLA